MSQDWERKTYTDVFVTSNDDCPLDYTELYENIWYGLNVGCDCIGICGSDMDFGSCYKNNPGYACDFNQTESGCISYSGFPPIRQAQFNGKRICGKNSGETFLLVTRPNLDNVCPETYLPCSTKTDAESTICYKEDEFRS